MQIYITIGTISQSVCHIRNRHKHTDRTTKLLIVILIMFLVTEFPLVILLLLLVVHLITMPSIVFFTQRWYTYQAIADWLSIVSLSLYLWFYMPIELQVSYTLPFICFTSCLAFSYYGYVPLSMWCPALCLMRTYNILEENPRREEVINWQN